jgi:hypothetical protein
MAETTTWSFSHKEVVEALIKRQGLHKGIWGLMLKFGVQGANMSFGPSNLVPAAIVPVVEIGLQKFDEVNSLSVDAAVVNPAPEEEEGEEKDGAFEQGEYFR